MRITVITTILLFLLLLISGCSKDDEVAELEKEIKESEAIDHLAETPAEDTAAEGESDEIVMTPEVTPEEEEMPQEMPGRPEIAGFTVQVAAGTNYEYVSDLVDLYNQRGYEAFVTDVVIDDQTYYRIRIGAFEDVSEARALGSELKDKYSVEYWIDYNQ